MAKTCKLCGDELACQNFDLPGRYPKTIRGFDDWPICHQCMVEHCCDTNCMGCGFGKYPECRFLGMKRHYMKKYNEGKP